MTFIFGVVSGIVGSYLFFAWVVLGDHRTKEEKKQQEIWDKD